MRTTRSSHVLVRLEARAIMGSNPIGTSPRWVDGEGECEGRGGREPPALYLRTAFGHNALNPGDWG